MKLVVIAVQPVAELFIALGTGMLVILDSPFFPLFRVLHPLCAFSQ